MSSDEAIRSSSLSGGNGAGVKKFILFGIADFPNRS
jgi:hypothetical protein